MTGSAFHDACRPLARRALEQSGFTQIESLGGKKGGQGFAHFRAERRGKWYWINMRAANKYEATGTNRNPTFNPKPDVQASAQFLKEKYSSDVVAYLLVITVLSGRAAEIERYPVNSYSCFLALRDSTTTKGILVSTDADLRNYECLACDVTSPPDLSRFDNRESAVTPRGPNAPPSGVSGGDDSYQVDVVGFLWASVALFDDGARDVDTGIVYRPPWHDLHSPIDARQRILAVLASLPEGASLERFLPPIQADDDRRARPGLRRRSAWATTLLAGLELARHGEVFLVQEDTFLPIHLRRADVHAMVATEAVVADELVPG